MAWHRLDQRGGGCTMRYHLFAQLRGLTSILTLMAPLSCSLSADWEHTQIADALRAAPPAVTHQAKIYAWLPFGQLVLVRDGSGPYTCVASGSASLRFAKPPCLIPILSVRTRTPGPLSRPTGRRMIRTRRKRSGPCLACLAWCGCCLGCMGPTARWPLEKTRRPWSRRGSQGKRGVPVMGQRTPSP
jgi:hypothetical protein